MNVKKKINGLRGTVLRKITRNIGRSRIEAGSGSQAPTIRSILISRPNHRLGNQLLITPLVQEVQELFPDARITLFVKGTSGSLIFKKFERVELVQLPRKPFKDFLAYLRGWFKIRSTHYDIVVNTVGHSSSGRLSVQVANATFRFSGEISDEAKLKHPDHLHMAKYPVYSFREHLRMIGISAPDNPVKPMTLKLTQEELVDGKKQLSAIVKNDRPTICIFTFATGAKCYSTEFWGELYTALLAGFSSFNIIEVLPVENVSQIGFKAPSFYSKDVREIAAFLAQTKLFIGADSGMMHLAAAAGVDTIGLFSVTNHRIYEPYNGKSIAIDTNHGSVRDIINNTARILSLEEKNSSERT